MMFCVRRPHGDALKSRIHESLTMCSQARMSLCALYDLGGPSVSNFYGQRLIFGV
jgi:hypothetical protein